MTSINLYHGAHEEKKSNKTRFIDGGFFISIGILILTLAIYGGFMLYDSNLKEEIEKENTEISKIESFFQQDDISKIVDFHERVYFASQNIKDKQVNPVNTFLRYIEEGMIEGVALSSIEYKKIENGGGQFEMDMQSGSYSNFAKQILSFKESEFISAVSVSNLSRNTDGLNMSLLISIPQIEDKIN